MVRAGVSDHGRTCGAARAAGIGPWPKPGVNAQAFMSTVVELAVLAGGAEDATAACSMAAPDDAGEELLAGEEAGLAAAAVWSLAPAGAGVAGPLLVGAALDC